ncbi:MAG: transposase [Deltaproteobacteria bacterium]|nr:transposase [Deltaproteobacteria bacterium]
MPRQARLDAPGTLHHVIARGIERKAIFVGKRDYEDFLQRLEAAVVWGGAQVYAWALIPNHFHLLLRTGEAGLPSVMRRILTGYAVGFNLRHHRHGHLFQNRYRSIVCEEETYLLELVRYIHLNPLRAGRVDSVDALARYAYAGHSAVLGAVERPWQEVGEVLGRFGGSVSEARRRYEQFVGDAVGDGRRPELVGGGLRRSCWAWREGRGRGREDEPLAYDERVLGSPEFVLDTLAGADWERRQALENARVGIGEVAGQVMALAGVGEEELRSASKRPRAVAARKALIEVAVRELGHSGAAVARYLRVVPSTVNRRAAHSEASDLAKRLWKEVAKGIS